MERKKQKDNGKIKGQFATSLTNRLEAMGWTMMDLAVKLEQTYEHTRKLCHGEAFPSWLRLKQICKLASLDYDLMHRLVIADKIQAKYGDIPTELSGKTPRFTKIERLLPNITEQQFEIVLGQLEGWDKVNRTVNKR